MEKSQVCKESVHRWSGESKGQTKNRKSEDEKSIIFATAAFRALTRPHQISLFSQLENLPGRWVSEGFYKLLLKLAFVDLLC